MKNRALSVIFILCSCLISFADRRDIDCDTLIKEVVYRYEIFPDTSPEYMCVGTLTVDIDIPTDTEKLNFLWTSRYPPRVFNTRTLDISGKTTVETSLAGMKAHTYFRVVFYIGGESYQTSDFAVDNYIDPIDLEYLENLQNKNAIGENRDDMCSIEVNNHTLSINCDTKKNVAINTLDGKSVYFGIVDRHLEIPLYTGVFILKYGENNFSKTKKIMIK